MLEQVSLWMCVCIPLVPGLQLRMIVISSRKKNGLERACVLVLHSLTAQLSTKTSIEILFQFVVSLDIQVGNWCQLLYMQAVWQSGRALSLVASAQELFECSYT